MTQVSVFRVVFNLNVPMKTAPAAYSNRMMNTNVYCDTLKHIMIPSLSGERILPCHIFLRKHTVDRHHVQSIRMIPASPEKPILLQTISKGVM